MEAESRADKLRLRKDVGGKGRLLQKSLRKRDDAALVGPSVETPESSAEENGYSRRRTVPHR